MFYSIAFPNMMSINRINLVSNKDATYSNLYLILKTVTKDCLFGDPYYGTNLLRIIYQQNSVLLREIVIDEIYTAITTYIPQLKLTRKNIKVVGEGTKLYAEINAINMIDQQPDLFKIELTDFSES